MALFDVVFGANSPDEIKLDHPESFIGTTRSLQAMLLAMTGYPDQARLAAEASVAESRSVKNPFALALSLNAAARVHFWRRAPEAVLETASWAYEVSGANGFPVWETEAKVLSGWARVILHEDVAALRDIEEGLADRLSLGWRGTTFLAAVHGEACLALGQSERGLSVLEEAIAFAEHSDEVVFVAELHRIKGLLLLAQGDRPSADAFLRRSLELAQSMRAKWFELRSAMGLVRLWPSDTSRAEAVSRLADAVSRFSGGFSVADLTEARALLDQARALPESTADERSREPPAP